MRFPRGTGGRDIGIPRRHRLRLRSDYQRLREQGHRLVHPALILNTAANTLGYPRIGIVVSRKVARKAVHRNRLKRRLRAIVRPWIPFLKSWDIVLVTRPPAAAMDFWTLRDLVFNLFTQADLWQDTPPPLTPKPS